MSVICNCLNFCTALFSKTIGHEKIRYLSAKVKNSFFYIKTVKLHPKNTIISRKSWRIPPRNAINTMKLISTEISANYEKLTGLDAKMSNKNGRNSE